MFHLPAEYGNTYNHLLEEMSSSLKLSDNALPLFWPMRGWQYNGDWLVIGHSPNGWDVKGERQDFAQPEKRRGLINDSRKLSEPEDKCPMLWLTDPNRYDWTKSNFFCVMNQIRLQEISCTDSEKTNNWASSFCYSNLFKVEQTSISKHPQVMRSYVKLLEQEISAFQPSRVLVLTNKERFSPFARQLGLNIKSHEGIVQGVANQNGRRWVVTQHPMKLPRGGKKGESNKAFADEVLAAFSSLLK